MGELSTHKSSPVMSKVVCTCLLELCVMSHVWQSGTHGSRNPKDRILSSAGWDFGRTVTDHHGPSRTHQVDVVWDVD